VVLDFLSATDVGRLAPAEEDVGGEVSEWELWAQELSNFHYRGFADPVLFPSCIYHHSNSASRGGCRDLCYEQSRGLSIICADCNPS